MAEVADFEKMEAAKVDEVADFAKRESLGISG